MFMNSIEMFFECCKSNFESKRHMKLAKKEVKNYQKYCAKLERKNSASTNKSSDETSKAIRNYFIFKTFHDMNMNSSKKSKNKTEYSNHRN